MLSKVKAMAARAPLGHLVSPVLEAIVDIDISIVVATGSRNDKRLRREAHSSQCPTIPPASSTAGHPLLPNYDAVELYFGIDPRLIDQFSRVCKVLCRALCRLLCRPDLDGT